MKKNLGIIIAIALGLSSLLLTIAFNVGWVKARPPVREVDMPVPSCVSYQGTISDGGVPFNGTGYFKFAIVDLGKYYDLLVQRWHIIFWF